MSIKHQAYKELNQRFLEDNAKAEGVHCLPSGVQYRIIEQGSGAIPTTNSLVQVYYTGKMINGKQFDSNTNDRVPAAFRVKELITGWQEILKIMPVGSRWKIYIPYQHGYGSYNAGVIKAYSTLVFEMELIGIA